MTRTKNPWLLVALALFGAAGCEDGGGIQLLSAKLVVDPPALAFGELPLGRDRTLTLTLRNAGDAALVFERIALDSPSSEFRLSDAPPARLTPAQVVELKVTYTALALGATSATLTLSGDAGQGPHTVLVTGVGVIPGLEVTLGGDACGDTPGSLSFGSVEPGRTVTRTLGFAATGAAPVQIRSASLAPGASGEWSLQPLAEGGVTLNQGGRLELTASYTPGDSGEDLAAFVITTDVPNKMTIRVPACGRGAAPSLCATPVPLDLGVVGIGPPALGRLNVENCGEDPLELTALSVADDPAHPSAAGFAVEPGLGALPQALAPGDSLEVLVRFQSTTLGAAEGWLQAETTAPTQPRAYFPLRATVRDTCQLLLAPSRLVYNGVVVGGAERKNVLLANNGVDACTIQSVRIAQGGGVYTLAAGRTAPFRLDSGATELLTVRYAPTAGGVTDNGRLEVSTGASTERVELLGNPPPVQGCQLELSPSFINFGAIPRSSSVLRGVEVRNVSETECRLLGATLDPSSSPQFTNVQVAPGVLASGATTTILVNFRAPASGSAQGILRVTSDDVDSPSIDVPLFGAAAQPSVCVEPQSLDFGSINNGTMDFRVHACGGQAVTITDLVFSRTDAEFSLRNPPALPLVLQPGQSQAVTVLYESADGVGDSAVVVVGSDDPVAPTIPVNITAGPVIVPPTAGRYLYYWQIDQTGSGTESNIFRMPLQGQPTPEPFWGPANNKACTGCHGVSPDGRYVAVVESSNNFQLTVIDTTTDITVALPFQVNNTAFFTWKPDVNANPPYQFAYDSNERVHLASVVAGYIGELQGANDPAYGSKMPSWGPNGKIAFARGGPGGGWGFFGPSQIMIVDETGGVPVVLSGADTGGANYYPAFSPNGEWIAFNRSANAQGTISAQDGVLLMAPTNQSGQVSPLANVNCAPGTCASSFPTWSLDGHFLSFSSNRQGGMGSWDLYIAPIDPVTGADGPAQNIVEANSADFQHAARWAD